LKTTLEGHIHGKKGRVRSRAVFLGCFLKTEEATIGYEDLKMLAQDRSSWRQWRWNLPLLAEYYSSSNCHVTDLGLPL